LKAVEKVKAIDWNYHIWFCHIAWAI